MGLNIGCIVTIEIFKFSHVIDLLTNTYAQGNNDSLTDLCPVICGLSLPFHFSTGVLPCQPAFYQHQLVYYHFGSNVTGRIFFFII